MAASKFLAPSAALLRSLSAKPVATSPLLKLSSLRPFTASSRLLDTAASAATIPIRRPIGAFRGGWVVLHILFCLVFFFCHPLPPPFSLGIKFGLAKVSRSIALQTFRFPPGLLLRRRSGLLLHLRRVQSVQRTVDRRHLCTSMHLESSSSLHALLSFAAYCFAVQIQSSGRASSGSSACGGFEWGLDNSSDGRVRYMFYCSGEFNCKTSVYSISIVA